MDPDFDSINNFIDDKINNYNKNLKDFENRLNIQDNRIKKMCKKKVTNSIKNNSKKTAKNLINLTKLNESDDTSENSYILEKNNIGTIEQDLLKKRMKGGNYNNNIDLVDGEVEIIEETILPKYDASVNSYSPLIHGTISTILIYIIIYLICIYMKLPVDKLIIFYPLILLTNMLYPNSLYYLESTK